MATVVIPTACLELVLQTPEEVLALVESLPPADRAEVSPEWLARVRSTPRRRPVGAQLYGCGAGDRSSRWRGCVQGAAGRIRRWSSCPTASTRPTAAVGSRPRWPVPSRGSHLLAAGCGWSAPTPNRTTPRRRGSSRNAGSAGSARSSTPRTGLYAGGSKGRPNPPPAADRDDHRDCSGLAGGVVSSPTSSFLKSSRSRSGSSAFSVRKAAALR